MALNKRERNLLIITVAVAAVILNWFLIAKLAPRWRTVSAELANRRAEQKMVSETIGMEPTWRAEYSKLHGSFASSSEHFDRASDVLKKIDALGSVSGVNILAKRQLDERNEGAIRELPVTSNFEANTEGLVRFLYNIQTSAGFMSVEQLQVTPRPDNSSVLRCDIQIRALSSRGDTPGS